MTAIELDGVDHLEWWVGNARQSAGFMASAFGFDVVAYAGPETGVPDHVSYVLEQGDVRFVVSGASSSSSPIAAHWLAHGDGVRDVAFAVDDAAAAWESALSRGAVSIQAPEVLEDDHGKLVWASVGAYGDTLHSFVERRNYHGMFAPGFAACDLSSPVGPAVGLGRIDHVVANVGVGDMSRWVSWYETVLGMSQLVSFDERAISTEFSALKSTVVWDGDRVVLPINEPAHGRRKSQIEEYLDCYGGPGVQHVALQTDDIVSAVRALRDRGVRFLTVPDSYYSAARARMAGVDLPWDELAALGILVDRDEQGHLLQIFTETVTDRPAVFFEIIQRAGAQGFGEGNFKALFEAIEREQARRGNL